MGLSWCATAFSIMLNLNDLDSSILSAADVNDRWDLPWPRLQVPTYREMKIGPWSIRWMEPLTQWRYFHNELTNAGQYTLQTPDNSWMSTAPVEIEGQAHHVAAAHGHVVVMGAGLGVALYNILSKPDVTRVTLVERDARVIELLRAAADLDHWAGIGKLRIEIADAFEYDPRARVDHLYVDIWAKAADPNALADTQQVQRRVRADTVGWWAQEFFFLRWLEQKSYAAPPTLEQYREWARTIELPLIGQDEPAYMQCIAQLADSDFYQDVRRAAGEQTR